MPATLRLALADPVLAAGPVADHLAEHLLLMAGLPPDEAREPATTPLPAFEVSTAVPGGDGSPPPSGQLCSTAACWIGSAAT